jgi:hypothetical protein
MLEQFQTCTPVVDLFRPSVIARSANASLVAQANGKNCRSHTQSRRSIARYGTSEAGKLAITKNGEGKCFLLTDRGTGTCLRATQSR